MTAEVARPRLLVVAGPNGTGKTTLTEQGLRHEWFQGCEYINPDLIARDEFGDWNSPQAVLQAAQEAEKRREACLADRRSLAFETVLGLGQGRVRASSPRGGYFVRLFFVGTSDPAINAARVARRVMQGGHDVPIPKIVSRYVRSIANCAEVAPEVDRLYLYDNSVDGAEARLVVRSVAGQVEHQYGDLVPWMSPIVARLAPSS